MGTLNWITDRPFPKNTIGLYLVWLSSGAHSKMRTASVFKISNGTLCCIGDHFYNDVIGDDGDDILAWCEQPAGPEF